MQSEKIGELAGALAKARAAFSPLKKSRTAKITSPKGNYSYNYADLSDLYDSTVKALSANGLALVQPIQYEDGHLIIETRLIHSSGEWIASRYPVPNYDRPQEVGSAITYGKRYSAASILGLAAEDDDDGQAAQEAEPAKRAEPRRVEEKAPIKSELSHDQQDSLRLALKKAGAKTVGDAKTLLKNTVGVEYVEAVPLPELANVLDALSRVAEKVPA